MNPKSKLFMAGLEKMGLVESAVMIADTILILGRDNYLPGAKIKQTIDLIERDLAWHSDVEHMPAFTDTVREIRAIFPTL